MTPGPTYHARYGEPILVRRFNSLPPVGETRVPFALPSTSCHLQSGHTASESNGYLEDFIDPGEFWDHHYGCFPRGGESERRQSTLWYRDNRMDFAAANVYAGLAGFFLMFDDQDSGNENDPNPVSWRLPSGKYDVPLLLQDLRFAPDGQAAFNPFNVAGVLGDKYTVNRRIQPFFRVARRKYRLRILNGGPSRCYELHLVHRERNIPFTVLAGDGSFLPAPLQCDAVYLDAGQRVDVIVDFSGFSGGEQLYLRNRLFQAEGEAPTGRLSDPGPAESIMRFDVAGPQVSDPSRIPDILRQSPRTDVGVVRRRRTWAFGRGGGLWTVNGGVSDPNRAEAKVELGTAELWTFRNSEGRRHAVHGDFAPFTLVEVNGIPFAPAAGGVFRGGLQRDAVALGGADEATVYIKFDDFLGKYALQSSDLVLQDHGMMARWDVVPKGQGDSEQRPA
jgi:FtsP/CotA-like multicopper oxidase with cupredoxin domain